MKLPASIIRKLKQIEQHQRNVKRLIAEVESDCGLTDVYDENQWTWGMVVDQQGQVTLHENSAHSLIAFLKRKQKCQEGTP